MIDQLELERAGNESLEDASEELIRVNLVETNH